MLKAQFQASGVSGQGNDAFAQKCTASEAQRTPGYALGCYQDAVCPGHRRKFQRVEWDETLHALIYCIRLRHVRGGPRHQGVGRRLAAKQANGQHRDRPTLCCALLPVSAVRNARERANSRSAVAREHVMSTLAAAYCRSGTLAPRALLYASCQSCGQSSAVQNTR